MTDHATRFLGQVNRIPVLGPVFAGGLLLRRYYVLGSAGSSPLEPSRLAAIALTAGLLRLSPVHA
jgi:hypothetical protein